MVRIAQTSFSDLSQPASEGLERFLLWNVDRLLEALRREHGEAGRADVAPEIARAAAVTARRLAAVTARRLEEAAELVPAA